MAQCRTHMSMAAHAHMSWGGLRGSGGLGRGCAGHVTCRPGLLGGATVSANGTGDGASAALPQPAARRKFWGWGLEGDGLAASEIEQLGAVFAERLGIDGVRVQEPPRVEELDLPAPRLVAPASLEPAFSTDPYDRAAHTYGRSFRDLVRAFRRDYAHAPDLVAFPRGEGELVSVLEWCSDAGVAAIPFGAGSSVVGGVEPDVGDGYHGVISVDLRHLQGVLEVDRTSRAARIAAGTLGPALEAQLKPYGLTLRHFPQSFEWSPLGGWIATRSGGHFATLHTHIDEFVEAVRVVTPRGVLQTRRLPASGGTITHHHAVGRDHRRWYLREVPQLFADALRGAKAELDPAGIMNPGVLLESAGAVTYSREGGRR